MHGNLSSPKITGNIKVKNSKYNNINEPIANRKSLVIKSLHILPIIEPTVNLHIRLKRNLLRQWTSLTLKISRNTRFNCSTTSITPHS